MAARLSVTYVYLGTGNGNNGGMIRKVAGRITNLSLTTTVLAAELRPVVPAAPAGWENVQMWVRLVALDNPVVVAWGTDPTVSTTPGTDPVAGADSIRVLRETEVFIPVTSGWKLSAVEAS